MDTSTLKIGDRVDFKVDVEGTGYIVEIISNYDRWMGRTTREFVVANKAHDASPWHPRARMSSEHSCTVVYLTGDDIW